MFRCYQRWLRAVRALANIHFPVDEFPIVEYSLSSIHWLCGAHLCTGPDLSARLVRFPPCPEYSGEALP